MEKYWNVKFHEITSSVAELFHADRRTDMTKLVVAFPNFPNASRKVIILRNTFSNMEGGGGGGGSCDDYCSFNKGAYRERKKSFFFISCLINYFILQCE